MKRPDLISAPRLGNPLLPYRYNIDYLPTAMDESLSLLQKVNMLIQYAHELGKLTQEMLDRWNEVIKWLLEDGVKDAVKELLDEWLKDGTLEELINVRLFEKKPNIYVQANEPTDVPPNSHWYKVVRSEN